MPSQVQTDDAEQEETIVMNNYTAAVKRNSLQLQTTRRVSKEKVVSPRMNRNIRLRDKSRSLKSEKPIQQTGSDHHAARTRKIHSGVSIPPMSHSKPWPGRKATGVEELVKYMSDIPCYLQRVEQGDEVQVKALNFGVIDWERLEKWAYDQKHVVNRSGGYSPSTSDTSSSFSTFGSSTQSCRSIRSAPAQRTKPPSLNDHWVPSVESLLTNKMEDGNSRRVMVFPDSRSSPIRTSVRHHQLFETNCIVGTDHPKNQHENKRKDSDMKPIPSNEAQPLDVGTSSPTSKDCGTSDVAHYMVKVRDTRSREAEKSHCCKQQNCDCSLSFSRDSPQDLYLFSQNSEDMWDHLQESGSGRCSSIKSTTYDNRRPMEVSLNTFSANFPTEDAQFTNLSPQISYSCPLPSTIQCDEPEAASTPLSEIEVPITMPKVKHEKQIQFTEQFVVGAIDRLDQDEAKVSTTIGRELSPNHRSSAGLNLMKRSSCLREGSSIRQKKWTACPDNSHADKATANTSGRHSPLRRILDPLLKSKNRILFPRPMVASPIHDAHEPSVADRPPMQEETVSRHRPSKPFGSTINSSTSQAKRNLNLSNHVSTSSHDSLQDDEGHVPSTRQALMHLTWKNGIPLLMLSLNDSNILAATMSKKSVSCKDNSECIYTILSPHDVKKKTAVWIKQRNKSKKHGLLSNVVGQLKVSSSELISSKSEGHFVVREFVLFGAELIPASHEPVSSMFNSELAAIIVKVTKEGPEGTPGVVIKSGNCWDSSQTNSAEDKSSGCQAGSFQIEQNPENLSLSSITALLPGTVHGLPAIGKPSPLIERWKSGGICDCGGWDEGCMLTLLTDKIQESESSDAVQAFPTTDGTNRIDLFVQGRTRKNRHAFSIVGCKEGVYKVEFSTSIALLQAFAICIATLHSRKPTNPSSVNDLVDAKSFQEHIFSNDTRRAPATTQGGAPTSYVPHYPPPSPVGRA